MSAPSYQLNDEEWEAVTDYVTGQATPDVAAAVERRLATEPPYAAHLAPILALWAIPRPHRRDLHSPDATGPAPDQAPATTPTAAAWKTLEAALASGPEVDAFVSELPTVPPVHPPRASARSGRPDTRFPWQRQLWTQHPWRFVAAITVLLTIGVATVYRVRHPAFRYTGGATGRVVTLPDGSVATLAPGAFLGTSHAYTQGTRAVYVFGGVRFHVAPDPAHPFVAHVIGVDATALGTTFGVTSDTSSQIHVDVSQGKVSLSVLGPDGVQHPFAVLTAGQAQSIPALTRWMTDAGAILGAAGVPFGEAIRLHNVLVRAAATAVRETR